MNETEENGCSFWQELLSEYEDVEGYENGLDCTLRELKGPAEGT